ncbi:MAG: MFS transporter [Nanoarchaeota archaeon]|nr:MFS transporter [Nanoarchaeota archaeon]
MYSLRHLSIPHFKLKNSFELSLVKFFFALALALLNTIWAVYMKSFNISDSTIGFINALIVILSTFFVFFCVNIIEKFSEKKSFIISSILNMIFLFLIAYFTNLYIFIFLGIAVTLSGVLRENSFNIIFRDNSKNKELNSDEAILSVVGNIAWFLGPILTGFLLLEYSFGLIFNIAAFLIFISLLLFFKIHPKEKKPLIYEKKSFKFLIKKFIKTKNISLPYLMSAGISFWWSFIFIYMPLFILEADIGPEYIGIFIGLTQLPLILFEYYAGKKSSSDGFKKFFTIGFLGLSIITLICFFITDIYLIMILLIFASFFMALIEPLRYSYIFSQISKKNEDDIIPLFSTSISFGSFTGKVLIAIGLLYFSSSFSFIILSIICFIFFLLALKIPNKQTIKNKII